MLSPFSFTPGSLFSRFISLLRRTARSYLTRSAMVVIGICSMIWFFGPKLSYQDYKPFEPVLNRVISIAVIIFLWGVNNLIIAYKTPPKKEKVSDEPVEIDPVETEISFLRQSFANAMKIIQEKWTGPEKGTKSLYALPWYVMMGPPASGKTSLITNADLKFPISHMFGLDSIKSVRPTDKPDYWVCSESVIFDLPGLWMQTDKAYSAEIDERVPLHSHRSVKSKSREARLWDTFMDLLRQYRPRRPINGVILCLDLPELIKAGNDEKANLASIMHNRLVELSEKLGTRFTVHIILTKIDKLAGFSDFFSSLSRTERSNPFGFSFSVTDVRDADRWQEEFDSQFADFMKKVNDDLVDRFYAQRNTVSRRNIYTFVRELAATGPLLSDFLKNTLQSDKFSTPPLVRGVYIVSPRQEGVGFNALLTKVAQEYDVSDPIMPAYAGLSQPYFSEQLFQNIIFKEAGLAGDNHAVERQKHLSFNMATVTCTLFLLGLTFFLHQAMTDNRSRADKVVQLTQDFTTIDQQGDPFNHASYLPALNAIRNAADVFPNWREASLMRRYLTLYEGRRVGPKVEEVYKGLLQTRFLPAIAEYLKSEVIRLGNDEETKDSDRRLETLRAYLLLGNLEKRDALDENPQRPQQGVRFIKDWMAYVWQPQYEGNKEYQNDLNGHLAFALEKAKMFVPLDQEVVEAAQRDLVTVPRDLRLFRSLENLAGKQLPGTVNLRIEIGPSFDLVYKKQEDVSGDPQLRNFYTKKGFHDFFIPQNTVLSIPALEDAWVAGEREQVNYSDEDLLAFRGKVLHRYSQAYIDQWFKTISNLETVDFENVDHAVSVLSEFNGPANPLGRLLALVKKNTVLYETKSVQVTEGKEALTELPFDENREQGLRVNRAFSQLNALTDAEEGKKPYIEELMSILYQLEAYLREIKNGQASSKPIALERAIARANLKGDDPIYALRRISANLPSPLNRQFEKIADEAWKVVLIAAKQDLQLQWQERVFSPYNMKLATRFPFRKAAQDEVSLEEFERFFGVNGDFEHFFKNHLKTFVNEVTGEPVIIDGQSIQISGVFLAEIRKIRKIRNAFFENNGTLSLRYTIEPVSLSQGMARTVLNVEGQLVPYSNGPVRPKNILWPNALSSKQNLSQLSVFRRMEKEYGNFVLSRFMVKFQVI